MRKIIILMPIFVLVLFIQTAFCAEEKKEFFDKHECSIGYSVYTAHFDRDDTLNEENHAILVSVDNWFISTFENSHYKRSWFGGYALRYSFSKSKTFKARANLYLGPLYGYEDDMPDVCGWTVGAVPTLELGYKMFVIETLVMPCDGGVVSCLFKINF